MRPDPSEFDAEVLLAFLERTQSEELRNMILEDLSWTARELGEVTRARVLVEASVAVAPSHLREGLGGKKRSTIAGARKRPATVLLVAVKPPELDALKLAFDVDLRAPHSFARDGIRYWEVDLDVAHRQQPARFVLTAAGFDENYEMASFIHTVNGVYEVEYSALVGMAAGLRGEVDLGDVVQAISVIDYVHGAITPEGLRKQPKTYALPKTIARNLLSFNPVRFGWHDMFEESVSRAYEAVDAGLAPLPPRGDLHAPRYHRGVILASDMVREDNPLPALRAQFHDKTLALEMEGAGFAAACDQIGLDWVVLRGVADYAEPDRSKGWQLAATVAAATAARCLFEKDFVFEEGDPF